MPKPTTAYDYRATVLRWVDGDTLDVRIDLGFDISVTQRVRLYGVNAPEMNSSDPSMRAMARTALGIAAAIAPPGSVVQLRTRKGGDDKYGRYLASVAADDGEDVATTLLSKGLAVAYFGGSR